MQIAFRKRGGAYSQLICTRDDGSRSESLFPNRNTVPLELIHYVVEKTLGLHKAFYGLVARGAPIAYHQDHNQALIDRQQDITQNWQSDLLVEAIQTINANGKECAEEFYSLMEALCHKHQIPMPPIRPQQLQSICDELSQYSHLWQSMRANHQLDVCF